MPKVYIIILNWNGWRDTIECLESVLRLDYLEFTVVLCDNGSSDGSVDRIKAWANGDVASTVQNQYLAYLTVPALPKPIPFSEVSPNSEVLESFVSATKLVILSTGGNLGFAGGNNVGIRYAISQGDCECVWLLNNDTVVARDSLAHLVERMRDRPDAGICGSTVLYYNQPDRVQALGGSTYNKWLARVGNIGCQLLVGNFPARAEVERQMQYVLGASMLVSRQFLDVVGLLNERYFLYLEEIDWASRGKGRFSLAYSPESVVFHKQSASIATAPSGVSGYNGARSRLIFTSTFHPIAMPTVLAAIAVNCMKRLANRLLRGDIRKENLKNAAAFMLGCVDGMIGGLSRIYGLRDKSSQRAGRHPDANP